MTRWSALIPFKADGGKSRLADVLDDAARKQLATRCLAHVTSVLEQVAAVDRIVLLAPEAPPDWSHIWAVDAGRGLNPELEHWRAAHAGSALLVIHADLPLLAPGDVDALLARAGQDGVALATDLAGEGSNALAIMPEVTFDFRFGPGSRALHCVQRNGLEPLKLSGLACDIDTPADLDLAVRERGEVAGWFETSTP